MTVGAASVGSAARRRALEAGLREMAPVMVALSGGVDSATLGAVAWLVLGDRSLAVTGVGPALSNHQRTLIGRVRERFPMPHEWVDTREMESEGYRSNGADRCFFCKDELYTTLDALARRRGFRTVVDGTNASDMGDVRPGHRAAARRGVRSPLQECGFEKEDVRELARNLGVPVAEEPASACLASRIPMNVRIEAGDLGRVEAGEAALRAMGFSGSRVRHHGDLARIELRNEDRERALEPATAAAIAERLREVGYARVSLDARGYRPAGLQAPATPADLIELPPA